MIKPARIPAPTVPPRSYRPRRYTVVGLFSLATVLCYVDRVSISVAIIPLAHDFSYDAAAQGLILSAFFWGLPGPQLAGGEVRLS